MMSGSCHTPHSYFLLQSISLSVISLLQHTLNINQRLVEYLHYFLFPLQYLLLHIAVVSNFFNHIVIKSHPPIYHFRVEIRNIMPSVVSYEASENLNGNLPEDIFVDDLRALKSYIEKSPDINNWLNHFKHNAHLLISFFLFIAEYYIRSPFESKSEYSGYFNTPFLKCGIASSTTAAVRKFTLSHRIEIILEMIKQNIFNSEILVWFFLSQLFFELFKL